MQRQTFADKCLLNKPAVISHELVHKPRVIKNLPSSKDILTFKNHPWCHIVTIIAKQLARKETKNVSSSRRFFYMPSRTGNNVIWLSLS